MTHSTRATPADVSKWVREETPEHMALLSRLRGRLVATMETDTTEGGVPTRDWCRALQRYQTGYVAIVTEERERIKLRLMVDRSGQNTLSDAEYEAELQQLAVESISTVAPEVLRAEVERRAAIAQEMVEREEDD